MRLSIKLKVVAVTVLLLIVGGGAVLYAVDRAYHESLQAAMEQTVADSQRQFSQLETRDVDKLDMALTAILSRQDIVAAFKARDREALYELCKPIYEEMHERNNITNFVFFEGPPTNTYFLRVHKPEEFGDDIGRASYLQAVETGDLGYGMDLGKHLVALRGCRPVRDADGTIVGYLELGQEVPRYLDVLKEQTGDEFAMVLSKDVVKEDDWVAMRERTEAENDWADNASWVVAGATSEDIDGSAREVDFGLSEVDDGGRVVTTVKRGDLTIARGIFPVKDATGKPIGAILLEHDMSDMVGTLSGAQWMITVVLAAMMTVLVVVLLLMLNALVFRRLSGMVAHLEDASLRFMGGDLSAGDETGNVANDEIGDFEKFFGQFLKTIASTMKSMSGAA